MTPDLLAQHTSIVIGMQLIEVKLRQRSVAGLKEDVCQGFVTAEPRGEARTVDLPWRGHQGVAVLAADCAVDITVSTVQTGAGPYLLLRLDMHVPSLIERHTIQGDATRVVRCSRSSWYVSFLRWNVTTLDR